MPKNLDIVIAIIIAMLIVSFGVGYLLKDVMATPQTSHSKYADITLVQTGGYKYSAVDNDTHDAFTPSNFTVYAGQIVNLTMANYDSMEHSFTSTGLNVNLDLPGNTQDGVPKVVHYQLTVTKPGVYRWWCAVPCDQPSMWAMSLGPDGETGQLGYMGGYVTVLA